MNFKYVFHDVFSVCFIDVPCGRRVSNLTHPVMTKLFSVAHVELFQIHCSVGEIGFGENLKLDSP